MGIKGCLSQIVKRLVAPIIMAFISAVVANFTTPSTAYMSQSITGYILFVPLLLYFLIAPFPVEALIIKLAENPKMAFVYGFFTFIIVLLPFGMTFLYPTLFFTALVSAFLLLSLVALNIE